MQRHHIFYKPLPKYLIPMEELSIGYLSTLYHTSFILRGSKQPGIKASWKLFPNGPAMMEAFEQGQLDLGYIGLPPAMIGITRGLKVRCVAGGHVEGTVLIGSQSFQVKEKASDALAQFKGKTIGTPRSAWPSHRLTISPWPSSRARLSAPPGGARYMM
jgi:hypothetical protein